MFDSLNLLAIFTTGLLAGGLSCIAVQGGLLASFMASSYTEDRQHKLLPITAFVISKLIAYTLLGALLGWFGSLLQLNIQIQVVLQSLVVLFMLGTALNLLNVHPIFRYFVIQPPHVITRLIRKEAKSSSFFAPAALGAFTVFIPCGVTQAMMALAIASGNPVSGAAILFAFILGTTPLFFIIGYFTMRAGDFLQKRFLKIAAFAILVLALFNLNNTLALTGTNYTIANFLKGGYCVFAYCQNDFAGELPVSEQTILITATGYMPNLFTIAAGSAVKINLVNQNGVGCQQAFTIPAMNIQKIVPPNKAETITFTAPTKPGEITFMCSMGMYGGVIKVI